MSWLTVSSNGVLSLYELGAYRNRHQNSNFAGTTSAAFCLFRHTNYLRSQDTTETNPSNSQRHIYKQTVEANQLTRVAASLGGMFISYHPAEMDIILGASLFVCGQIGQQSRGGPTGDAQFEGGGAGGDAAVQIVHPGGGLEEVGGFVQGHG